MTFDHDSAEGAIVALLTACGLDPSDSRLRETPRRAALTLKEFFAGVGVSATTPLLHGDPVPEGTGIVTLRNLEFHSTCEHHLLPFSGAVHIAYEPRDRLIGIGSLVRCMETLSARPQLQERLTQELATSVHTGAGAAGAFVIVEARHGCVADRGPLKDSSRLVTSAGAGSLASTTRRLEVMHALSVPM